MATKKKKSAKKAPAKRSAKKAPAKRPAKNPPNPGKWLVGLGLVGAVTLGVVVYAQRHDGVEPVVDVEANSPQAAHLEPLAATIPEALRVEIVRRHPHDTEAFTQGLLWHGRSLYESTGLEGHSSLREVELTTGDVARRVVLEDEELFAEGLALAHGELFQLTWQNNVVIVYDATSFEEKRRIEYDGEGWGLCFDGRRLVMSDGSATLTFRDPATFDVTGSVEVSKIGRPLRRLNELECVDGQVYANVWQTDEIVRIDPRSGHVTAVIDARGLLEPIERRRTDVLNGIAWAPDREAFLITGKLWPWMFEVRFVPR